MSDLKLISEDARQNVADADVLRNSGLDTPEKVAIFARLMFSAGFAECQHATEVMLAALSRRARRDEQ